MGRKPANQLAPVVNVSMVGELDVYVVHEHELDKIAEGSSATLAFNGAIALISIGITFTLTLTTTTVTAGWLFYVYLFVCINFLLVGSVLLIFWWRTRKSVREVVAKIKGRMPPPPGIQEAMPAEPPPARGHGREHHAARLPQPGPTQAVGGPSARYPTPSAPPWIRYRQHGGRAMTTLSNAALALFRLNVERRGQVPVDDSNRESYRELESAGMMLLSRPFTGPRVYRMTKMGWRMVDVLARLDANEPSPEESALPRR